MAAPNDKTVLEQLLASITTKKKRIELIGSSSYPPALSEQVEVTELQLTNSAEYLSNVITRFAILFGEGRTDYESAASLVKELDMAMESVTQFCEVICLPASNALRKLVSATALELINSIEVLAASSKSKGDDDKVSPHLTGLVWSCCKKMPSVLVTNKAAVITETNQIKSLINDGLREITEAQKQIQESNTNEHDEDDDDEDDDDDDDDNDIENLKAVQEQTPHCVSIMKSGFSLLTNIRHILAELSQEPLDIILCLYTGELAEILQKTTNFRAVCFQLIELLKKHAHDPDNLKRLSIVTNLIEQSFSKLSSATSAGQ